MVINPVPPNVETKAMSSGDLSNPYVYSRPLNSHEASCLVLDDELKRGLDSIAKGSRNSGLDLFGPRRRGKTTFANILMEELEQRYDIKSTLLHLATRDFDNLEDFLGLLRQTTPYQKTELPERSIRWLDEVTHPLADLACGVTDSGTRRHCVVLDGTESLSESVWSDLLDGIRTMALMSRRTSDYPGFPEAVQMLRWILVGTRDVFPTYRWLSGAGTAYSPFDRIHLRNFSDAQVIELAGLGLPEQAEEIGKSIFRKTNGYRCLTQRFLSESFDLVISRGLPQNIRRTEELVSGHDDPNWQDLLKVAEEIKSARHTALRIAEGGTVLNYDDGPTAKGLLSTGVIVSKHVHELVTGNEYYKRRITRLWGKQQPVPKSVTVRIKERFDTFRGKSMEPVNILAVFANPRGSDPLRLETEDRVINECIRLAKNRDRIKVKILHAATIHDVRRALLEEPFKIVQFSGHGSGKGLIFENESGRQHEVGQEALAELLSAYSPPLECVILNACYTVDRQKPISMAVPYSIGMNDAISDQGATEFARGFYDAIGAGKSFEFAYEEGCRTIKLMGLPDASTPVIIKGTAKSS